MGMLPAPVGSIASRLYDPSAVALPAVAVKESIDVYTIWNNDVTKSAHPTLVTGACEGVHTIRTRSIDAWVRIAFVNVVLAVVSIKTRSTRAGMGINAILACSSVQTRVGGAFVDIDLALFALVAVDADAAEVVEAVDALAIVFAGPRVAVVWVDAAVSA